MLDTVHDVPELLSRISCAIDSSPYIAPGKVRIESGEAGQIRLHGKVETFFEKQMAQESIRHIAAGKPIENMLEVTW